MHGSPEIGQRCYVSEGSPEHVVMQGWLPGCVERPCYCGQFFLVSHLVKKWLHGDKFRSQELGDSTTKSLRTLLEQWAGVGGGKETSHFP